MLVIACASTAEAEKVRNRIRFPKKQHHNGALFISGLLFDREIILVETGVGPKRSKTAAQQIVHNLSPSCVVLIGAAGAVDPLLQRGDMVIIEKVLRKDGPLHDTRRTGISSLLCCNKELSRRAHHLISKAGFKPVWGDCLTAERFVHHKGKKQWIHKTFRVHVVEMESAAMAAIFSSSGIPFINIRIISDTAEKSIVDYEKIVALKKKRGAIGLGIHLMGNPSEMVRLMRFRKDMLKVRNRIGTVVQILVKGLPDPVGK